MYKAPENKMLKVPENKYGWSEQRGNRHERGYGAQWDKIRKVVLHRDDSLCQECLRNHRVTPGTHVDHILSKAKGGTDDLDNLQCLCEACHNDKTLKETGRTPRKHNKGYDTKGNPVDMKDWK